MIMYFDKYCNYYFEIRDIMWYYKDQSIWLIKRGLLKKLMVYDKARNILVNIMFIKYFIGYGGIFF